MSNATQILIDKALAELRLTKYGWPENNRPTGHMKNACDLLAAARSSLDPPHDANVNPFRHATGLVPGRTDDGVDYFANKDAPITAFNRAKIVRADPHSSWPGGTAIGYVLLAGPNKGERVYLVEFCSILCKVGDIVTPDTVISRFTRPPSSGVGIEIGFGVGGNSQTPTDLGKCMARLLKSVGCPVRDDPGPGSSHGPKA